MDHVEQFWGKAQPSAKAGARWHPLVYHSLDVAATTEALLAHSPRLTERLSGLLGLSTSDTIAWVATLGSLHDVGKFSLGFQGKAPAVIEAMGLPPIRVGEARRHDVVGQDFVGAVVCPELGWSPIAALWFEPSTGHHGYPPGARAPLGGSLGEVYPPAVREAALTWVTEALSLLWGCAPLPPFDEARWPLASWLISGVVLAADWIGSDQGWFPYTPPTLGSEAYLNQHARPQAARAIRESGVAEAQLGVDLPETTEAMFPWIRQPTPVQHFASTAPLPAGPQLWIIEEATGGGKTEAALTLAARLLADGRGAGLYVALPTMATADAAYDRLAPVYNRLFASATQIELAHGRARQAKRLRARANPDGTESAEMVGAAWLESHRRAALLAPVGVGTIDQALLGALAVKFQGVRLLGVARSVLIVDEVHACDPYMVTLLARLLTTHAALGGSAILLTATLTLTLRAQLVAAFHEGVHAVELPWLRPEPPVPACDAFPLVSSCSEAGLTETALETRVECQRTVELVRLNTVPEAVARVLEAAAAGACVAWVRNTIGDALAAVDLLRAQGADPVLFHSRFTYADRQRIERDIVARFGPRGVPEGRAGRIVVSTQVIEQSLDLDFDVMVSDLAPIDLLIQRAGRVHRHARGDRGSVVLHVLCPAPRGTAGENWLHPTSPKTRFVYRDPGVLWRTAVWVEREGRVELPRQARAALAWVFDNPELPEGLSESQARSDGEQMAQRGLARNSAISPEIGFTARGARWPDDDSAATRIGPPTTTLTLCRALRGGLQPWSGATWADAEVAVPARLVSAAPPPPGWSEAERSAWLLKPRSPRRHTLPVVLGADGRCEVTGGDGHRRTLIYTEAEGLHFEEQR